MQVRQRSSLMYYLYEQKDIHLQNLWVGTDM